MPSTPLLGITQVSASQNSKEVTINDAILALENATNAKLAVSFAAATSVLLSDSETTRNFLFVATGATEASTLKFPNTISSNNVSRIVAVRNDSGFGLTVQFNTGTGETVSIPDGSTRLLSLFDGTDVIVAAEPATVVNFLSLTDSPDSYSNQAGKFLAVNVGEDALEFLDAATFPTLTGQGGKYLVVNDTEDDVEWTDIAAAATTFVALTDTPANYTDAGGKLIAVKADETGVEYIDVPDTEAVEFISAARWRIRVVDMGSETQAGFGEIQFRDLDGVNLVGTGAASASTFATGKEAEFAFDNNFDSGAGWLSEDSFVGTIWIEYAFDAPETVRSVRLYPITGFPGYTPTRVVIEYYDGSTWVSLGDRTTAAWVEATAQTFKVNGVPLSSVSDAPSDGSLYARRNADWETFALGDTLPALTGNAGKVLAVNVGEDATEWVSESEGLSDAPSDGTTYGRKDAAWVEIVTGGGSSTVQTEAADYTIDPGDVGNYIRLTNASTKSVTVDPEATTALPANGEWNFRNVGAGNATLIEGTGVTINPPAGGTLVLETGMTVTLKRVAADEFDLIGQTVQA